MEWISFSFSYAWHARIVAASITTKTMIRVKWYYLIWKQQKLTKLLHVGAHGRMVRLMLWYSGYYQSSSPYTHKKGYCILNDKQLPLHNDLLRSILHIFDDTHWAMMWNWSTISHCWYSSKIEPREWYYLWLQTIIWPIIYWLATSLLNEIPALNMATYRSFSKVLALCYEVPSG